MTPLQKRVCKLISNNVEIDLKEITLDASLASIDCEDIIFDLALEVEDEFDLDAIDDDVAEGWRTVGDICDYVQKHKD